MIGAGALAGTVPAAASAAYARNLSALLAHLVVDGVLTIDPADEITGALLVTPRRDPHLVRRTAMTTFMVDLTVFVLSLLVGVEVIGRVPATLHTPLMSGANAIHGIVLVGGDARRRFGGRLRCPQVPCSRSSRWPSPR